MPLPDNVVAEFTGTSGTEYYIYQIPDDTAINQVLANMEASYGTIGLSSYLTGILPKEIPSIFFFRDNELTTQELSAYYNHPNNITFDGENLGSLLFNIVTNSRENTGNYNFFYDTEINNFTLYIYLNDGRTLAIHYDASMISNGSGGEVSITNNDHIKFQNNPNITNETQNSFNNYEYEDIPSVLTATIYSSSANVYQLAQTSTDLLSDNFTTIDTHTYHYKNVGLYIVEKTSSGYTIGSSSSSISYGTYTPPIICFPKNTPVTTDQGDVPIQDLENKPYTIEGNKVLGTVSMNSNEPMVYFKQHSLAYNVPNKNTYITQSHVIYHNNTQLKAIDYTKKDFHKRLCINNLKGIKQEKPIVVKVENNKVYNVVLESGHKMKVNNMLVETLHPSNNLYKQKLLK